MDEHDWASALTGDGEAFGRVFDRHRDRVRRHCYGLVPDRADAEDVIAVVFLEAWRRRYDVRVVEGSVLPWLLVTATNVARNVTRSGRRYRALLDRLPVPEAAPDHADTVGEDVALRALAELSQPHREVLTLCVVLDMSEREAAEVLGVPPGTVKSRLSRAKSALRRRVVDARTPHHASERGALDAC